jgi:hypothetical protein
LQISANFLTLAKRLKPFILASLMPKELVRFCQKWPKQ